MPLPFASYMSFPLRIALSATAAQAQRLTLLQRTFAAACNALAPLAQQTRCWNRVALHHMAYRQMRERFPQLGSQMVCNAIYSVSRTCRLVYQHPQSPFHLTRLGDKPLPLVRFLPDSPVYFDRHTLSIKDGQVSMFTLDGRMRFQLGLTPTQEQRFRAERLREIALLSKNGVFRLDFSFAAPSGSSDAPGAKVRSARVRDEPVQAADRAFAESRDSPVDGGVDAELPEYILITDSPSPAESDLSLPALASALPGQPFAPPTP